MMTKLLKKVGFAALLILGMNTSAMADSVIKFSLGETTDADLAFSAGVLGTVNDGVAGTTGNQDSSIRYVGSLEFLADVLSGASFTLSGVTAVGDAIVNFGAVSQGTTGGTFSFFDDNNSLLLSGVLDTGVISGGLTSSTGSFFNSNTLMFTAGSLLSYILPTPGGLSIAMSNILDVNGVVGMSLPDGCTTGCQIQNFTASADGLVDGTSIPEPTTLLLLMSGLLGGRVARARKMLPGDIA